MDETTSQRAPEPDRREREAARLRRREAALLARASMSPPGPAPDRMRLATWNINSLRARLPAVERFLGRARPDVVCLQETKTAELQLAAADVLRGLGYSVAHIGAGSYNGVAVLSRHPIDDVVASGELDDEHLDREPRVVSCVVEGDCRLRVVSVYVPHGRTVDHWHYQYKLAFLDALAARVRSWNDAGELVVIGGDLNVAPTNNDVFHPDAFTGATHVTAPEREALGRLFHGLVDVDTARWGPRARRFTWWNYGIGYSRNLGMRIDLLAVGRSLADRLDTTWIDHVERGAARPSDHAALIADFFLAMEQRELS